MSFPVVMLLCPFIWSSQRYFPSILCWILYIINSFLVYSLILMHQQLQEIPSNFEATTYLLLLLLKTPMPFCFLIVKKTKDFFEDSSINFYLIYYLFFPFCKLEYIFCPIVLKSQDNVPWTLFLYIHCAEHSTLLSIWKPTFPSIWGNFLKLFIW